MADQHGASLEPAVPFSFAKDGKRHYVLIAAILASALGFIDGSVVSIALPAMRESLGAGLAEATWIHNGYMLMLSAFLLTGGALGDKLGLGRSFAAGIAAFVAASVFCALAQTPGQMITARLFQGLGAAVMVPGSLAAISRAYPRGERGAAIGLWAASSSLTTAIGPMIGGLLLSFGGPEAWRFIFAVNLPLGALAIWLILSATQDAPSDPARKIDILGAVLASLAFFLIAFAFTQGQPLYAIAGLAVLAVFVLHELRALYPMVDIHLFTIRDFSAVNLATLFMWMGFQGILFFLPMTLITGWGQEPYLTALCFAPMSVCIALFSRKSGRMADRYGSRGLITAGALVMAASFVAMSFAVSQGVFFWGVLPATALLGTGIALMVTPMTTSVVNSVPDEHAGTASGVNNAAARVAGLMGVAALGVAAQAGYVSGDGTVSFGAVSDTASHGAATLSGFHAVALASAVFALIGAGIVRFGMGAQASSSASQ